MAGLRNRPDLWFEVLERWARRACGGDQFRRRLVRLTFQSTLLTRVRALISRIQVARGIMMYEPAMGTIDALAAGRDAFARQAWTQAHTQLSAADRVSALELEDVERLAVSAYLIGLDEASEDLWARAHAECVRRRDIPRATRCSFWLVVDLLTRGQAARANGWLARAQRLLDDEACECAERGLLLAVVARWQIKEGNLTAASESRPRGGRTRGSIPRPRAPGLQSIESRPGLCQAERHLEGCESLRRDHGCRDRWRRIAPG